MKRKYYIIVKNTDIKIEVAVRTYYKILNEEIGVFKKLNDTNDEGYEISLETLKRHPKLYNKVRKHDND